MRNSEPKIGSLSSRRSLARWTFSERFSPRIYIVMAMIGAPMIRYQLSTKKSDMAITTRVGAGRLAPKLENTPLIAGITKIIRITVTAKATVSTAIG